MRVEGLHQPIADRVQMRVDGLLRVVVEHEALRADGWTLDGHAGTAGDEEERGAGLLLGCADIEPAVARCGDRLGIAEVHALALARRQEDGEELLA